MAFLFENLDVYRLSLSFHNKVISLCKSKKFCGYYHLVDHLKRSSLSVALNLAEGNGRFHAKDKRNFYAMARGSAFECVPIITLCINNEILTTDEAQSLRDDLERLSMMMTGLMRSVESKAAR